MRLARPCAAIHTSTAGSGTVAVILGQNIAARLHLKAAKLVNRDTEWSA
jgi:hypothetical protein